MSPMSLGSCLFSEMSICPLCPQEAVSTVRCPYVPYVPYAKIMGHTNISLYEHARGHRGHMDISLYEWRPGDIGDIRTSLCTNGSQERGDIRTSHCTNGFQGTYGHLTVRTALRGHIGDILYKHLPRDIGGTE